MLFLVIVNLKYIINTKKTILIAFLTIFISWIITLLYPLFGIFNTSITESLGIPIQQIAYVVSNEKNITNEQLNMIEKVIPIADIKENHYNMIVDKIKWSPQFNEEYLVTHLSDYFKLYIQLFFQNPKEYLEAFLLQNSGFWSFTVNGNEAYVSNYNWYVYDNLQNKDLIYNATTISLSQILNPQIYLSGGLFFWITAISFIITSQIANKKFLLGYLPLLTLWATIMIATPIAVSLRYVYALVLAVPLNLVYPLIAKKYTELSSANHESL